jgi:hypothetical protein
MYSRKILPGILIGCTSWKDSRVFMKVSRTAQSIIAAAPQVISH